MAFWQLTLRRVRKISSIQLEQIILDRSMTEHLDAHSPVSEDTQRRSQVTIENSAFQTLLPLSIGSTLLNQAVLYDSVIYCLTTVNRLTISL